VSVLQFAFILLVPLVVVAGVLVGLFAVGALFDFLDNPGEARARVEGLFQRPASPARPPRKNHFYQAHWLRSRTPGSS
jgi:hypothetical protein